MQEEIKSKALIVKKEGNFFKDKISPILAYFSFTTKYIFKKKSTIIFPIISFILIIGILILIKFMGIEQNFFSIFWTVVLSITIIMSSFFATIKALNLFKDISNEGIEILIVSKPIERWQIIFVRFLYFLLIGIIFSLINYFATLIGFLILGNVIPNSFNIFGSITIYYFSILLAYLFFGTISILLSLKFSTKLVTGFSSAIVGFGVILNSTIPTLIPMVEKGFYSYGNEDSSNFYPNNLTYIQTDDKKIIVSYVGLNEEELKVGIQNRLNSSQDLSWIINLNNFINPIAGITKMAKKEPNIMFSDYNGEKLNFLDYNFTFNSNKTEVILNSYNGNNNFIDLKNSIYNIKYLEQPEISINLDGMNYNYNSTNVWRENDFINLKNLFNEKFDSLSISNPNPLRFKKFLTDAKEICGELFGGKFNEALHLLVENKNETPTKNIENESLMLFFYLYSLEKINNDFVNSTNDIKSLFLTKLQELGDYKFTVYSNTPTPIISQESINEKYLTFSIGTEKVNSAVVGISWSSIILVILVTTIFVYYRKDFV